MVSLLRLTAVSATAGIFPVRFSIPWGRGEFHSNETVFLSENNGSKPIDTESLAFWEDGSVKWTSHSLSNLDTTEIDVFKSSEIRSNYSDSGAFEIVDDEEGLTITNAVGLAVSFGKNADDPALNSVYLDDYEVALNGSVIGSSSLKYEDAYLAKSFNSSISTVEIEKQTSDKVVVLTNGVLTSYFNSSSTIEFKIRTYIHIDSDVLKFTTTILYDLSSNENLRSLGLSFFKGFDNSPLYDRHIKFSGSNGTVLSESVQSLTGLRRGPTTALRQDQADGIEYPDIDSDEWGWNTGNLTYVPPFDEYSLTQLSSNGFEIHKRFKKNYSRVKIGGGTRNDGVVYLGSPQSGGITVGVSRFWEKYPAEIDLYGLTNDEEAGVNIWFYSPKAQPLEVTSYHDGLGQDTYAKQTEGLLVTYEDYESGFDIPTGIGRSFETFLKPSIPSDRIISTSEFDEFVLSVRDPALYIIDLEHLYKTEVYPFWKPRDEEAQGVEKEIGEHLDLLFDYYVDHVELNDWYGFFDYGDVMHTYDTYRHRWRYDVGGYAWDNSELSTDLWLWLYYLHTGDPKAFRLAESMTQHTAEVDIYHLGKYKGLGTRHGIQHWSDSSKQLRISNSFFKRFYYYLSGGDERIGEVLKELEDSQEALTQVDSHRKVQDISGVTPDGYAVSNFLDWGSLLGAWLYQWEKREDGWENGRDKLINSINSLSELPYGFISYAFYLNVENGTAIEIPDLEEEYTVSHLTSVFGLIEAVTELIEVIERVDAEASEKLVKLWTDYAIAYNGGTQEQLDRYGVKFAKTTLKQSHSRATAYAAWYFDNSTLGQSAWEKFFFTDGYSNETTWELTPLSKNQTLSGATEEAIWLSTNDCAQYGLSAIYLLEKVGQYLDSYN